MCLIERACFAARDCTCVEVTMKQFCLGIIVAIGLTLPAFGQASLKEQLVGTWTLVSCSGPWCAGNNGTAIYESNGRYAVIIAARGRPKANSSPANREAVPAEEYKAVAAGFFANFGTWSLNGATITHHIDGALFPNIEGTDFEIGTIRISGDELTWTDPSGGYPVVWRRIRN
jgi:hypothetical protein